MAAGNFNLGKASGGILNVSPADGTTNTSLVLPASGTVVATDVTVTDNAIARYDGTTGKVQNSGIIIDDSNNVIQNGTSYEIRGTNPYLQFSTSAGVQNGYIQQISNDMLINVQNAGVFTIRTNNTDRVKIDANGNIGIGVIPGDWSTGANTRAVQMVAGSLVSDTNSMYMYCNAYLNSAGNPTYGLNSYALRYNMDRSLGQHAWSVAPIGNSGNTVTWATAVAIQANGNFEHYQGGLYSFSGSGITSTDYANSYVNICRQPLVNTTPVFAAAVSNVLKSAILANGSFQSATNSYGSTSDAKLKENVVETSDKLNKLMNVRVVNFNYIGDDQKQIGVIAQEVEKIFPSIVYETKDTEQVEVTKTRDITDEEGNVTTEEYTETETVETGEVTKNVKYSVIYMMMLKGMQEMNAKIEAMQLEIDTLKGAK